MDDCRLSNHACIVYRLEMIFIFERLPNAVQPVFDLTKSFNNFSTAADIAKKVETIQRLRETFYANVS